MNAETRAADRRSTSRETFRRTANGDLVSPDGRGHNVFIHPRYEAQDATDEALKRIGRGDFGIAPLMLHSDLAVLRPAVLAAARAAAHLEPNLAQVLSLLGGAEERSLLRRHLEQVPRKFETERDAIDAAFLADARLRGTASVLAARVLARVLESEFAAARRTAAMIVSNVLMRPLPIRVERLLAAQLSGLLAAEDRVFVAALPSLMVRQYRPATRRCERILAEGSPALRHHLMFILLQCDHCALRLLLQLFELEPDVGTRASVASHISAALSPETLESLAKEALAHRSASVRLDGSYLLGSLDPRAARRLAKRRDPDPTVDAQLNVHRVSPGRASGAAVRNVKP